MMSRFSVHVVAMTALMLCAPACGELNTDELADDLAGVELPSGKDDSTRLPTAKGALLAGTPAQATLSRSSGFHTYTFAGRAGSKVKFVLKSRAYRTYLRITSPAGTRWNAPGVRDRNGAYYSTIELTLRLTGTYKLLATSYNNLYYGTPRSLGDYTLSADASNVMCGGIAAFQCPTGQKCLLDGAYPDAAGTCVAPDACRAPVDCEGNVHVDCVGAWSCNGAGTATSGTATPGTCAYTCRAASECDGLDTGTCAANPRCEIVARGCENNHCDPSVGPCHPCDPIPVCEAKQWSHEGESCGGRGLRPCADGLFCSYPAAAICGRADGTGTCARRPEMCTALYDPVCGCDGLTYGNSCSAASAGISVSVRGACPRP